MFLAQAAAGSQLWKGWWLAPACALAVAAVGFGIHTWRLRRVRSKLQERFEERLSMRTRVAQELHDGMLQSVVSASMQLHAAIDELPEDSPSLPAMNHVLELMGQIVNDGRNTLRGLRSSIDGTHDLADSLAQIPEELGSASDIGFRLEVEGKAAPLRPLIRDGVYSIVRQAIVNAFRDCRANSLVIQLQYSPTSLRISVRDDGCGIDPEALRQGRERDGGLAAMRMQAEKTGGRLRVWSRPGGGTEVEFHVPGRIAFESHHRPAAYIWLPNLHWLQKEAQPAKKPEAR